ncbi:MAG TPA: outer membrane lipoprotein carrier protein LolA [Bacilli bacterium]
MNRLLTKKLIRNFLMSILSVVVFIGAVLVFSACKGSDEPQKVFAEKLTKAQSYKVEGIMESYYESGRKQNEFKVLYKYPEMIKVEIKAGENADKQIILKNNEGVYILIPAVNKNFKIQSDWPDNASYPYLLQSLAKDIANDPDAIVIEDGDKVTVETKTKMHADATPVKQKIIFDKTSKLPTEVLVYDEDENLYIRTVFTHIDFDYNISDDEFDLEGSMAAVRLEIGEEVVYEDREIHYPLYCPEGITLTSENIISNPQGTERLAIMKYGTDYGFTLIQEFVNDNDVTRYQEENGEIFMVLGNVAILKDNSLQTIYRGIEYTVASEDLIPEELAKIVQGFLYEEADENPK